MPAEAFWPAEELLSLCERVKVHCGEEADSLLGLLFVALSYRWLTGAHPDPDGFTLELVARIASGDKGGKGHLNHVREKIFAPLGLDDEKADFALFWDFASLFQAERTDRQQVLFRAGLTASNIWYGHAHSVMWMQPTQPEGFTGNSYEDSGKPWRRSPRKSPQPPMRHIIS